MDFSLLLKVQGFVSALLFITAVVFWYKIKNGKLLKCKRVVNFALMISFVLLIKALNILPDPGNGRMILQHLFQTVIALGLFFEARKIYNQNFFQRKEELKELARNPLQDDFAKVIVEPELRKLGGLRKLIKKEHEELDKKMDDLEKRESKLLETKEEIETEKERIEELKKELDKKEKRFKILDKDLEKRNKNVKKKEKNYGKKEEVLIKKRKEIAQLKKEMEEEKKEVDKQIRTLNLLEEDLKDQKEDIQIEQKKLKELKAC